MGAYTAEMPLRKLDRKDRKKVCELTEIAIDNVGKPAEYTTTEQLFFWQAYNLILEFLYHHFSQCREKFKPILHIANLAQAFIRVTEEVYNTEATYDLLEEDSDENSINTKRPLSKAQKLEQAFNRRPEQMIVIPYLQTELEEAWQG